MLNFPSLSSKPTRTCPKCSTPCWRISAKNSSCDILPYLIFSKTNSPSSTIYSDLPSIKSSKGWYFIMSHVVRRYIPITTVITTKACTKGKSSVNIGSPAIEPSDKIMANSKIESWRTPRFPVRRKNRIIMPNMSAARIINSATNVHVVS